MQSEESYDPIPGPQFLFATEFIHGAGVVIFHRSSRRVVLVQDRADPRAGWFFPKGRKDVGETLPETACREGEEESGYPNRLLPVRVPTRQPPRDFGVLNSAMQAIMSGGVKEPALSTEALYTHFMPFNKSKYWPRGGVYILSWFVAEVSDEDVARIEAEQAAAQESDLKAVTWEEWLKAGQPAPVDQSNGSRPNGTKSGAGAKELKPLDPHELQYKAELVPYEVASERLKRNYVMSSLFETALILVKDLDRDQNGKKDEAVEKVQNGNVATNQPVRIFEG